ncbi:carbohydrate ABC transporter permease [Paenibacillus sp. PR3]|uniref:Carbohydrate ABC transporter permease n=1 Tax=Paenibacillus terricola TaxID=2763503 RepID=A0ABR8N1I0_9BACL|nr:carbohydrate ABC transporter permease [Paenibacillus terricola]MBD3921060.1 carbohydrate ABC transporter permease [Paenibacillus terricola]
MASKTASIRNQRIINNTLIYAILIIASIVAIVPILWMLSSSLKTGIDIYMLPPEWIPSKPQWGNFHEVLTRVPFFTYMKNTVLVTGLGIIGTVLSSTLVAYGLARINFRGSNIVFMLILATMMIPPQVTIVPQFLLFRELGWNNTLAPLIVPEWFGSPYNIFLLRQFFVALPRSLDEAAMLDGLSVYKIFWKVTLPLSKPVITTVSITAFMFFWNDFFKPLIFISDDSIKTLTLGILEFKNSFNVIEWNYLMAAAMLMLIPCVVLFFVAQRYFVEGISVSGMK